MFIYGIFYTNINEINFGTGLVLNWYWYLTGLRNLNNVKPVNKRVTRTRIKSDIITRMALVNEIL